MREVFADALAIVERCLLSVVAIFLAMIAVGIAAHGGSPDMAPRTMNFHNVQADAVTSAP